MRILHLWFARKAALEASDTLHAQAQVIELRAYMQEQGITADPLIARGFAYEGYENLREGNFERAREAFDQARTVDPYLPQAQLGYAWSLLRSGRGVFTFLSEYTRGVKLHWGRFVTDEVQISNFTVIMALALLCSMLVFSLVVIARCQGRARHDLFEAFRRLMPEGAARVLAWAVFVGPLLVWIGGVWLILYWMALCFRYMRFPEKAVAASVFVMMGLAPVGVTVVLDRLQASTDPETRVVVAAMQEGYHPETLQKLREVLSRHEDLDELRLLLGISCAKGDLLSEAFDEYKRILDRNPANAAALVNLGNVYLRLGEAGQAATHYKEAARIHPEMVSAYWNLYLAQTELLHFKEAEASLAAARELDPTLTGRQLSQRGGQTQEGLLLEEPASLSRIKGGLRTAPPVPIDQPRLLLNPLSLASGSGLLVALALSLRGRTRRAQACARCGRAYCRRCGADNGESGCCSRCLHLFRRKKGVTAEAVAVGMARLQRRDRLTATVRRILSLALPGSGQILAGRVWFGLPVLIGWVCGIIFLVLQERLLLTPRVPVTDLIPLSVVLAWIVMLTLWIVGNTASTRRRAVEGLTDGA